MRLERAGSDEARMLTELAKEIYASTVLPQLVQAVNSWKTEISLLGARWHVRADLASGIHIQYVPGPGSRECFHDIVCPSLLDEKLSVGWQHRSYASVIDPKYEIAQTLMGILMSSPRELRELLRDEEMDEVANDLYDLPETSNQYESDGEQRDFAACSAEDCGYCGRCPY